MGKKRATVEVLNRQRKVRLDSKLLRRLLSACAEAAGATGHEVAVVLLSNRAIQKLNRRWRGVNKPTDCISFPSDAAPGARPTHLGDIAISAEMALEQAMERAGQDTVQQVALYKELLFLFIHSLLHLMGYDHERKGEAIRMRAAEKRVLRRVTPLFEREVREPALRVSFQTSQGRSGQA